MNERMCLKWRYHS